MAARPRSLAASPRAEREQADAASWPLFSSAVAEVKPFNFGDASVSLRETDAPRHAAELVPSMLSALCVMRVRNLVSAVLLLPLLAGGRFSVLLQSSSSFHSLGTVKAPQDDNSGFGDVGVFPALTAALLPDHQPGSDVVPATTTASPSEATWCAWHVDFADPDARGPAVAATARFDTRQGVVGTATPFGSEITADAQSCVVFRRSHPWVSVQLSLFRPPQATEDPQTNDPAAVDGLCEKLDVLLDAIDCRLDRDSKNRSKTNEKKDLDSITTSPSPGAGGAGQDEELPLVASLVFFAPAAFPSPWRSVTPAFCFDGRVRLSNRFTPCFSDRLEFLTSDDEQNDLIKKLVAQHRPGRAHDVGHFGVEDDRNGKLEPSTGEPNKETRPASAADSETRPGGIAGGSNPSIHGERSQADRKTVTNDYAPSGGVQFSLLCAGAASILVAGFLSTEPAFVRFVVSASSRWGVVFFSRCMIHVFSLLLLVILPCCSAAPAATAMHDLASESGRDRQQPHTLTDFGDPARAPNGAMQFLDDVAELSAGTWPLVGVAMSSELDSGTTHPLIDSNVAAATANPAIHPPKQDDGGSAINALLSPPDNMVHDGSVAAEAVDVTAMKDKPATAEVAASPGTTTPADGARMGWLEVVAADDSATVPLFELETGRGSTGMPSTSDTVRDGRSLSADPGDNLTMPDATGISANGKRNFSFTDFSTLNDGRTKRLLETTTVLTQNLYSAYAYAASGDIIRLTPSNTAYTGSSCTGSSNSAISSLCIKKRVTIECAVGTASGTCTFDGLDSKRLVNIESTDTTFQGITFTRGYCSGSTFGAAISVFSSTATLTSCIFSWNEAQYGGAIRLYMSSSWLTSCTFSSNSASLNGGGIDLNSSQVTFTSCTFISNTAWKGGAINVSGSSTEAWLYGVYFSSNSASNGGGDIFRDGGGSISVNYSCPAGNTSSYATQGSALGISGPVSGSPYSYTCFVCAAGRYRTNSLSACTSCDAGRYLSDAASLASLHDSINDCAVCVAGKYVSLTASSICSDCPVGRYLTDAATSATYHDSLADCVICAAGTYSTAKAATFSSTCVVCPAGSYLTADNLAAMTATSSGSCLVCPSGTFLEDAASSAGAHDSIADCLACSVGKYLSDAAASPSAHSFASQCKVCPGGTYNLAAASSSCTVCPAGRFLVDAASSASFHDSLADCVICPSGRFLSDPALSAVAHDALDDCTPCVAGKYLEDDSATAESHVSETNCVICAAGSYADTVASSECAVCPAGRYLVVGGGATFLASGHDELSDCTSCDAGKYLTDNAVTAAAHDAASDCQICGEGKFSAETSGAAVCTGCSLGKHLSDAASSSSLHDTESDCTVCAAGRYSTAEASAVCKSCVPGKYIGNGLPVDKHDSALDCELCPVGTYAASAGSATCIVCAVGKTSPAGAANCDSCPRGYSCESGIPVPCSEGTYSSGSGSCEECPAGHKCPGGTDKVACAAGSFQGKTSQTGCVSCDAGSYQNESGQASCAPCLKGFFCPLGCASPIACGSAALTCPAESKIVQVVTSGYYSTIYDSIDGPIIETQRWSQTLCEEGNFCIAGSRQSCVSGFFQPSKGQSACLPCSLCPAGKIVGVACDTTGDTTCTVCPKGRYSDDGQTCKGCDKVGEYSSEDGAKYCKISAAGTIPNSDRTGTSQCPRNYFSYGAQDACGVCAGGTFSVIGSSSCKSCPAGSYSAAGGDCVECGIGKYSFAGTSVCSTCAAGYFSHSAGAPACTACPAGSYLFDDAMTPSKHDEIVDCEICGAGRYSTATAATASSTCESCSAGTYNADVATSAFAHDSSADCAACAVGKYSESAASSCTTCDDGTVAKAGSSKCTYCVAGRFASNATNTCELCDAGSVSVGGVASCTLCAKGYVAGNVGSSVCEYCGPGTMSSASTNTCEQCLPSKFSSGGADFCETCLTKGTYTDKRGAAYCSTVVAGSKAKSDRTGSVICPVDTFSTGATDDCTDCGTGFSKEGSSTCSSCGPGKYKLSIDTTITCEDCAAGKYTSTGVNSVSGCVPCGSGTFSSAGAAYCEPCRAGTIESSSRANCTLCEAGKFSGISAAECSVCEAGKFNDQPNSEVCKRCGAGFYSSPDSTTCLACSPGRFLSFGTLSCSDCDAGKYSSRSGSEICQTCPARQTSPEGSNVCSCITGFQSSGYDSSTNTDIDCMCPPGYFFERGLCSVCPTGTFKNYTANTDCLSCGQEAFFGSVFSSHPKPSTSPYDCTCSKGDFRSLYQHGEIKRKEGYFGECSACPAGTDCSLPGVTLETLPLIRGFWRSDRTSSNVVQCYTEGACPQLVQALEDADDQCNEGHEGPICNVCKPGYVKSVLGLCDICEKKVVIPTNFLIVAIVIVLVSLLIACLFYVRRQRRFKSKSVSERLHYMRNDEKSWFQRFKTKFKILMSFYQISSQFESILKIRFPPVFENFGRFVSSIVNLDALQIAKVGCIVRTDFYTKLVVSTLGPIIATLFIFLTASVFYVFSASEESKSAVIDSAVSIFLTLTYTIFASVSTTVFDTFNCQQFGDDETSYMASDQSINCDDPVHKKYQFFAFAMIAVYPIGIPLLYWYILYRSREDLKADGRLEIASLLKISFLWDMYRSDMWWFEVFDCVRRLSLTGLLIFVFRGRASQIVFAMIVSSFSVVSFVHLKPYLKKENDSLAIVSQVAIFFTLFAALLKHVRVDEADEYDQNAFGCLLVMVNVIGIGMVISGFLLKPILRLVIALGRKHIHSSSFMGKPAKDASSEKFLSHFMKVATSTSDEAGWIAMTAGDLKSAVGEPQDWLDETKAFGEWRCSTGDGPIDECRVTFTIDANIADVWLYATHDEISDWDGTVLELATLKDEGTKKTQYYAIKLPFPLSPRDYLWEIYREENSQGRVSCARSIQDEHFAPLKRSQSEGRIRAVVHCGGYFLSEGDLGLRGSQTKIVYAVNSDLKGLMALDFIWRIAAPKQLVNKVNEFRKFADVMAGPAPPPGYKHPLSFMWKHEGPLEYRGDKKTGQGLTTQYNSGNDSKERGSSFFDVFSGFAKNRLYRTKSGSEVKAIVDDDRRDDDVFFTTNNPMAARGQREKYGGGKSGKKGAQATMTGARSNQEAADTSARSDAGAAGLELKHLADSATRSMKKVPGERSEAQKNQVWRKVFDERHNSFFYYREDTYETTWERPADFSEEGEEK